MPRVLIVDDEYIERKGLSSLFHRYFSDYAAEYDPISIYEAENGRDALDIIRRCPPHIMLTDIRMPQMDGITLLSEARKIRPELVTIIISAYGEFEYAQKAIEFQVSHYLLKPIDPREFEQIMRTALESVVEKPGKNTETANVMPDTISEKIRADLMSVNPDLRQTSQAQIVSEVLRIMNTDYMNDLSVESVASRVHLSPSYLSYLFKHSTGQTIVKYLNNLRMEHARDLLMHTNARIADVALQAGYRDVSYFCTQYKNKYGVTPTQTRESAMNLGSIGG